MLDVGGQDATEAFEDVGHSDEARETLEQLLVGTLKRKVRTSCSSLYFNLLYLSCSDMLTVFGYSPVTRPPRPNSPPSHLLLTQALLVWELLCTLLSSSEVYSVSVLSNTSSRSKARRLRRIRIFGRKCLGD